MNVGFVMLAHDALHRAAQVSRLIAADGNPMVIHVDRRSSDEAFRSFKDGIHDLNNVKLAPRIACDWGTWSLVQASRDAAESLLSDYPDLTHVALISGSCLPIKPLAELQSFLSDNPGTDFIESVTIGDVPWTKGGLSDERFTLSFPFAWKRQKRRFDLWVDLQRRIGRRRALPSGLSPHMGSQWWCLTRETLECILNDPNRQQLDRYFKRVWIPDESYFQSLVRLYDRKVVSRSLTLSKFDFLGKPHVFYDDHLLMLRQSPAFFARKIWPGANRLYRAFLDLEKPKGLQNGLNSLQVDRNFSQAVMRRTRGRAGLVMPSRFPREGFDNGLTAAPYSVFHGFTDIFVNFEGWVESTTGGRVHHHLFAKERAGFQGNRSGFAGALTDSPELRNYDPASFLRNLIWNTRGEHQSFMFGPNDEQGAAEFMALDRNATISVVTGAWALPLLRSGQPIEIVRKDAASCQKIEAAFLKLLRERRVRARVLVWPLLEFLERPTDPLQEIIDTLTGTEAQLLSEIPKIKPVRGLSDFLQALRNAGMNPHLAGEAGQGPFRTTEEKIETRQSL